MCVRLRTSKFYKKGNYLYLQVSCSFIKRKKNCKAFTCFITFANLKNVVCLCTIQKFVKTILNSTINVNKFDLLFVWSSSSRLRSNEHEVDKVCVYKTLQKLPVRVIGNYQDSILAYVPLNVYVFYCLVPKLQTRERKRVR